MLCGHECTNNLWAWLWGNGRGNGHGLVGLIGYHHVPIPFPFTEILNVTFYFAYPVPNASEIASNMISNSFPVSLQTRLFSQLEVGTHAVPMLWGDSSKYSSFKNSMRTSNNEQICIVQSDVYPSTGNAYTIIWMLFRQFLRKFTYQRIPQLLKLILFRWKYAIQELYLWGSVGC